MAFFIILFLGLQQVRAGESRVAPKELEPIRIVSNLIFELATNSGKFKSALNLRI